MMPTTITPNGGIQDSDLVVITSNRVILDETRNPVPATLEISPLEGKIVAIHPRKSSASEYPSTVQFHDYGDLVVMPGLVDSHVHIDEPYMRRLRQID
jgi:allantoinase